MAEAIEQLRESIRQRAESQAQEQFTKPQQPQGKRIVEPDPWNQSIHKTWASRTISPSREEMEEYGQELQEYEQNIDERAEAIAGPQEAALDVWENAREGVEEANEAAMEDRETMLAEIEAFEEGYNEDWIQETLSREKAYWDAQKEQALDRVHRQFAAMGRTADPYVMSAINRQFTAKAADAIQERRVQLESERAARRERALQLRHKTYMGTQRQVLDPARASQIVRGLGQASSQVEPEQV